MRYLLFCLIACLTYPVAAFPQSPSTGSAELAMLSSHWPCADARASENALGLKQLRKTVLWNTFGNDTRCLRQYLRDERMAAIEIHLINEVCARKGNCGRYEFLRDITPEQYEQKLKTRDPTLVQQLRAYLQGPSDFLAKNRSKETACFVSPGLESNLSHEAAQVLIELTRPFFPACKVVWSPVGNSRFSSPIPDTLHELHGSDVTLEAPCIANLDGEDIAFPDRAAILPNKIASRAVKEFIHRLGHCENVFLWIAEFNGIRSGIFEDPRQRRAYPDRASFDRVNRIIAQVQKPM